VSASRPSWIHSPPADTPASLGDLVVCLELKVDDVGVAGDRGRQGVPTGLPHQQSPVSVFDLQVVLFTSGVRLNVEGSEY